MLIEVLKAATQKKTTKKKLHDHNWLQGLPLRMRFQKSRLYESAITPILLGLIVGFVAAMMGIGGAFLMVPAMIYIVGMPVKLIPGTSLFVTIFISWKDLAIQVTTASVQCSCWLVCASGLGYRPRGSVFVITVCRVFDLELLVGLL